MKTRQIFLSLLFLFVAGLTWQRSTAQTIPEFNRHSYRLNGGVLTHFGDIKQNAIWPERDEMKLAGSFHFDYHLSPVMSLSTGLMVGTLGGMRDHASFETRMVEFSLNGVLRLNQLLFPHSPINNRFSIYGFGGIGILNYDAAYYEHGSMSDVAEGLAFVMPLGAGVAVRLGQRVDLYLESAQRISGNDWLDGFIGSPDNKDVYNFTSIGLAFRLGGSTRGRNWSSRRVVHEQIAPPPPPLVIPREVQAAAAPEKAAEKERETGQEQVSKQTQEQAEKQLQVPEQEALPTEVFEVEPPDEHFPKEALDHEKNDFFVIMGSFGYRNNADTFAADLRSKGFSPIILRAETGLYRVSVDSFFNRADATQRLQQIRSHFPEHKDAWLLIRKR